MNYFLGISQVEEIKQRYRRLAFSLHPDRGGTTEAMQELNQQYHQALKGCHGATSRGSDGEDHTYRYDHNLEQAVIDKLGELIALGLPSVRIMLVGTWVWVDGETRPVKDQLKAVGLRWHSTREKWFWHAGEYRRGRSGANFGTIAAKYGYQEFEGEKRQRIAKTA
ncbi:MULTISPECIES: J domain-containing protein [Cyanophyceae]|uniref:J domain-containing protein n=1 Tax=Cyanophyceae TaxID=3028117 RepID=UPI001682959B|nr:MULTISPECIES: J domain-containing protein [Cyanophyceae]MBD1919446.1 J domain-containing protein [Phormidium sp. FACHB-77]MBD2054298.1 J domain-containing protein [Leptolyngbya sp. FACHB-60]